MAKPEILKGVRKVLFYGDSLTDGSDYPEYVVNTLEREFPGSGFQVMNSAICGNTAADLLRRLKNDVLDRKPDLVSICIGTNDRLVKREIAAYKNDLEAIVTSLLDAGIKVLLVKPSPLGNPEQEKKFQDNLAAIQQVADSHHLTVADAHQVFLDGAKAGKEMLGADGVHHGKDGFEGMARAVLDAFGLKNVPIEKTIRPWPFLLLDWETSSPFPLKEAPEPAAVKAWNPFDRKTAVEKQPWWDSPFAARGGWMPFAPEKPVPGMAAYGRTHFRAAKAGKAELRLGGSPQAVWLNGRQVWKAGKFSHGYHPDAESMEVGLAEGDNEIVVLSTYMAFVGVRQLN